MKKEEQLTVPTDHIWLRIIGFALALLVAVSAISYGVVNIGRKEAGYQKVDALPDGDAVLYAKDIRFYVYLDGDSDRIKSKLNTIRSAYSAALLRCCKLLDAETEYEGVSNVATLNAHIGEDVAVSEELWRVLLDAQEKTREQKGYNVFDGAFYRAWQDIRILENPEDFDPLRSEEERERLAKLCEAGQDLSRFELVPVDAEKHILRLEVSEDYRNLLRELEQEGPILDLGLLHDAYELRLLSEAMEREGCRDGYLSAASGVTVTLSGNRAGELSLYGLKDGAPAPAAERAANSDLAVSAAHAFALDELQAGYYALDGQLRHPWLPASGLYRNLLLSALVVTDDPVKSCYVNLQLFDAPDLPTLRALAAASDAEVALILNDGTQLVYTDSEAIKAREDYGWHTESLT